ncbi:vascular endothelial growth factor B, partial [Ailuropoda melanoleuca]|uniref:vascular endothelial growth factor B n=1 Tax=Ailuropoda melanoleuca TaxID=9646 RepID=UPI0014948E4A
SPTSRPPAVPSLKVGGSGETRSRLCLGDPRGPAADRGVVGIRPGHPPGGVPPRRPASPPARLPAGPAPGHSPAPPRPLGSAGGGAARCPQDLVRRPLCPLLTCGLQISRASCLEIGRHRRRHRRGRGRSQVAKRGQGPVSQPDALGHQKKVVSWIDVYARATCQPREVVVPLTVELMGSMAKQLVPSCVTVQRCGGCCPDDGLECVPTGQHQVRMQVLGQVGPKKRESALKPDSPRPLCPRCSQRRQRPDPRTCRCRCRRRSFLRCQGRGLELNPDTCRCRKLRR